MYTPPTICGSRHLVANELARQLTCTLSFVRRAAIDGPLGGSEMRLRHSFRLGFVEYALIALVLAFLFGLIMLPYWLRG